MVDGVVLALVLALYDTASNAATVSGDPSSKTKTNQAFVDPATDAL